ncbi:MAG: glycine cleavage system protein GcvH [Tissierellia bacterium]|nr:glycine cleavage system protein GcvH [Bacillota bacterium]NLL22617.1 glycine cleavage system protein GcvH [Tissierellia bacterium]
MNKVYYTKEHEWIKLQDGKGYVGLTDFAQDQLGDIVYVELPEVGTELEVGEAFGVVESVKSASDIFAPVSGEVVAVNEELEDSPELINDDAMENWLIQMSVEDEDDLENLMDEEEYNDFIGEE